MIFAISNSDGNIHDISDNSHLLNLDSVIKEHKLCLVMHSKAFYIEVGSTTGTTETTDSILSHMKAYDVFEAYDLALSRLLVKSLVSPTYRETIKNRFLTVQTLKIYLDWHIL